jgi:hypothetical protein
MSDTNGQPAKLQEPSIPDLCQRFGIECLIVGDAYDTDLQGKPIPEEDRKKWMVTTPARSFPTALIKSIPLAESVAQSLELAAKYLMLRDRDRFMNRFWRGAGDEGPKFPAIPTPVYLAFIMDPSFWPWNEHQKVHAADVVIEVDGVSFEQSDLEPATFENSREVFIVEGDVFEDFTRLHSLREHFESWIIGYRPLNSGEARE